MSLGVSDVLEYLGNNILGINEKAVIEVIDLRKAREPSEQGAVTPGNKATVVNNQGTEKVGFVDETTLADVLDPLDPSKINEENPIENHMKADLKNVKAKYFTVHFNPNTLRMTGHSGGLVKKTDFTKSMEPEGQEQQQQQQQGEEQKDKKGSIAYGPGKTYIDFSVSLLFDKVDNQDAFLEDKLAMSPTSLGKGVAKAVKNGIGRNFGKAEDDPNRKAEGYTVQPEVEGFIAALRNENTRLITFHWGDFYCTGILRNVNAVYTMFSINGRPIRATVDLTVTCADSEIFPRNILSWNKLYQKSFSNGSESFVKYDQKAKSLINL